MDIETLFRNSALHDYRLEKIEIDYTNEIILLVFFDPQNNVKNIVIGNFIEIIFSNKKEWGEGTYVVSSDISCEGNIIDIKMQFNSGDICNIKYSSEPYSSK